MRTSILRRPRRLSPHRRADHGEVRSYTLDWEEPGTLETAVGRAANLALATLPGFTLPGDISATSRYYARDIGQTFELDGDGCLVAPFGPGTGVELDLDVVEELTQERWTASV
ncbi:MAG: hypothetical protein WBB91_01565 [Nostocoides sp.]|uniref:hypothetical protein n=1 Tax=Nostocoides sp. TaxID=1917966 RepID=UPI003C795901